MARRNLPKRETKKPKKKGDRGGVVSLPEFASAEVEVIGKRTKWKEREKP